MNKHLLISIIAILVVWTSYYLAGSLISWSWNMAEWPVLVRLLFVGASFFSFLRFLKDIAKL